MTCKFTFQNAGNIDDILIGLDRRMKRLELKKTTRILMYRIYKSRDKKMNYPFKMHAIN